MKRKVITILTAVALAAGATGFSYAADSAGSMENAGKAETSVKACNLTVLANRVSSYCRINNNSDIKEFFSQIQQWRDNIPGNNEENVNHSNTVSDTVSDAQTDENKVPVSSQTEVNSSKEATEVVKLVNSQRSAVGLKSLSDDSQLNKLARLKAEDMAAKGYFSHTSPTYGSAFDMLNDYGVSYKTAGENIAMGQKTAEAVMNGWMNSSGHKANILNDSYTNIGVGYAVASDGTTYWVQLFKG